jgi:hypothetical protein
VYSDIDFHRGIARLADYKALILNTHPSTGPRTCSTRSTHTSPPVAACSTSGATGFTSVCRTSRLPQNGAPRWHRVQSQRSIQESCPSASGACGPWRGL